MALHNGVDGAVGMFMVVERIRIMFDVKVVLECIPADFVCTLTITAGLCGHIHFHLGV